MGVTWHVNGTTQFFLNGTKVFEATFDIGNDGAMPIQPGGVLVAGQEADKPWGDFDQLQSLEGIIDEVFF